MYVSAAVSKLKRRKKEEKEERRTAAMADVEAVKRMITEKARSIEAQNFRAKQLNREEKDRLSEADTLKEVEKLK